MDFDHAEKMSSAIKNWVQIVVLGAFFLLLILVASSTGVRIWTGSALHDLGITALKLPGVEFGFKEQAEKGLLELATKVDQLEKKLQAAQARPAQAIEILRPKDTAPPPDVTKTLSIVDTPASFWVYVGAFNTATGKFVGRPNFQRTVTPFGAKPNPGDEMVATTDTYERAVKPFQDASGTWHLGDIRGVVPQGQKIRVLNRAEIEGDNGSVNLWAEAAMVN